MSTRSRIGILEPDGSVTSIYCHWDGYPAHVGAVLFEHWRTEDRVRSLIALGDLSAIGAQLGEEHDFDSHRGSEVCNAYGRDRGESDVSARSHDAFSWPDYGQEYVYLFDPSTSMWRSAGASTRQEMDAWIPLADAIVADGAALPLVTS